MRNRNIELSLMNAAVEHFDLTVNSYLEAYEQGMHLTADATQGRG